MNLRHLGPMKTLRMQILMTSVIRQASASVDMKGNANFEPETACIPYSSHASQEGHTCVNFLSRGGSSCVCLGPLILMRARMKNNWRTGLPVLQWFHVARVLLSPFDVTVQEMYPATEDEIDTANAFPHETVLRAAICIV